MIRSQEPRLWLRPNLSFLVLVRLIDHESAAIFRQFAQMLVMLVPFRARLEDKDASLVCPCLLYTSSFRS